MSLRLQRLFLKHGWLGFHFTPSKHDGKVGTTLDSDYIHKSGRGNSWLWLLSLLCSN